ncbi:MAG: FAD-dependent oxidoreductase [Coriobacteriia bacterium]|nr:FAD-dependent oxidoreductase [Coriobacteriia bacterium]
MEKYDLLICGAGAAGMTAGVYGGRARLKTLILEKGVVGGTAYSTRELANYPGFYAEDVSGPFLMKQMAKHAERFGTKIIKENVIELDLEGDTKVVKCKKGREYGAKALILAFGTEPRLLGIPGEKELRGSGVSYCATCDAENFEGDIVAVVGNGDAALEEAMFIAKFAEKVIIIVIHDEGIVDCNKVSAEKAFKHPKLEFVWNTTLAEIKGDEEVESIVMRNLKTGENTERKVGGVFFYVGLVPQTACVKDKLEMNRQGYIITNEKMETSVPGVYAVGDCREKYLRQVVTAAGDGATAAVAAEKYLEEVEEYEDMLQEDKKILLGFWSPLSQLSIEALSRSEQIIAEYEDAAKLYKIDLSRKQMLAYKYEIKEPASFVLLSKNAVIDTLHASNPDTLEATLRTWLA